MSIDLGQEILLRWNSGIRKIEIGGLNASARALSVSEILLKTDRRIAVVCSTFDEAIRFHQELKTFCDLLSTPNNDDGSLSSVVDLFGGWEHSPYKSINPSLKARVRRLRALYRICAGASRALITDIRSFTQLCPPISALNKRSFSIRINDTFAREDLIAKLEAAGYMRSDPVEDPGSYTVRGSLVDVFSTSSRMPYRIDFFDDLVESIRFFDPRSQRSHAKTIELAEIVPVTDFVFNEETVARAKTQIKSFCDEHGVPKKSRDVLFESLGLGVRDPAFDYLAPYFYEDQGSWVIDILKGYNWDFAVNDSLALESTADDLEEELSKGFKDAVKDGRIVVPWTTLYQNPTQLVSTVIQESHIQFDPVLLGVPAEAPPVDEHDDLEKTESALPTDPKIQFKLIPNTDLRLLEEKTPPFEVFATKAKLWSERGFCRVFVASTASQAERMLYLLEQKEITAKLVEQMNLKETGFLQICEGNLTVGFRLPSAKLAIVTDSELFGPKKQQRTRRPSKEPGDETANSALSTFVPSLEDLNPGELVVHSHHGIGRYHGLIKLEIDRVQQDFLLMEYAGGDKLYLPVYRLDLVQKYIGVPEGAVLDKLGSSHFEKTKDKVRADLQDVANHLLQLYAKRASRHGHSFSPITQEYREFEAKFPFAETPDQLKAIEDVEEDMESEKIMDRLICGDVGYGKTEVAMRAAFKAVIDGKQVAVLVPTTVLALQHERSFRERFKTSSLPFRIESLSRFKSRKETLEIAAGIKQGTVDIAIGTHRLLSRDVQFKDLGLLIVDEEQRFGVEHKERLKHMKVNTDVLTLTATPIPRTLQMSLMGLRDISVINTPPADRLSVRTYVSRFDEDVIKKAIETELARGGQVFFIHNRVQSIEQMAQKLHEIVPAAKVIVGHGQLDERELESRMLAFYNKEANVLLCSTIIESGLDIPSANTMIINRADTFGLSQLYQLRGRVGRSQTRAYCFLLLPEEGAITEDAKKRLEVLQRFVDLGSGFKIASHDLELRGGGDVLGRTQSGHIAAIGYELYMELLDETIREMRGLPVDDHFDPEIKLPVPALLPETYVPDVHQRLGLYKRLSQAVNADAIHEIELELQDRYGRPTAEVQNLFGLIQIKQLLRAFKIRALVAGPERTSIDPGLESLLSPVKTLTYIQKHSAMFSITPDSRIILKKQFVSAGQLYQDLHKLLTQVADQ